MQETLKQIIDQSYQILNEREDHHLPLKFRIRIWLYFGPKKKFHINQ